MKEVTERDFRMPEFKDSDPNDYEFRSDGKIVRKDRWQSGIISIVAALGMDTRSFEIEEVVNAVEELVNKVECQHKC